MQLVRGCPDPAVVETGARDPVAGPLRGRGLLPDQRHGDWGRKVWEATGGTGGPWHAARMAGILGGGAATARG